MNSHPKVRTDDKRGGARPGTDKQRKLRIVVKDLFVEKIKSRAEGVAMVNMAKRLGHDAHLELGLGDEWETIYPLKTSFREGDIVYVNQPDSMHHAQRVKITQINPSRKKMFLVSHPQWEEWGTAEQLSTENPYKGPAPVVIQYSPVLAAFAIEQAEEEVRSLLSIQFDCRGVTFIHTALPIMRIRPVEAIAPYMLKQVWETLVSYHTKGEE